LSKVVKRQDEGLEDLLRRFKTAVKKENILADYKRHRYFVNKAMARELKSIEAKKRMKKHAR